MLAHLRFFFLTLLFLHVSVGRAQYGYTETGLPVCYITLEQDVASLTKQSYSTATLRIEQNGEVLLADSVIDMRLRGNATLYFDKKSYKIKFRKKTSLFGMPKDKSWVLLANYTDKSLMRTAVGLEAGRLVDFGWVPQSVFVELVVNGEHLGNYQLAENVKKSKHRVDISDTGFMVEFDFDYASALHYFKTDIKQWPFTPKYPDDDDETVETNFNYAREQMNQLEAALFGPQSSKGSRAYAALIDEDSWARWYYWKNLLQMDECNRYYVKYDSTPDSKLQMGPLWDFEWTLGAADSDRPEGSHYLESKLFFTQIAQDSVFMRRVAILHLKYGPRIREKVLSLYDSLTDSLQRSQALNFERWPILSTPVSLAKTPLGSWEAEVACDRQFFLNHYAWLENVLYSYLPDDVLAGISDVNGCHPSSPVLYSIGGQRLSSEPRHGVYIKNGRKVLR